MAMTNAEKQRTYRARQAAKLAELAERRAADARRHTNPDPRDDLRALADKLFAARATNTMWRNAIRDFADGA